tara:strand:+ start:2507 stop:2704 length:198 start_codon:yes stop_codon:yes gene_type:complete
MLLNACLQVLREIEYSGAALRRGITISPSIKSEILSVLKKYDLVKEDNGIIYITEAGIIFLTIID